MLHVDYSERYKNVQQNQIPSAYFGKASFSLFTASCYHLTSQGSMFKHRITVVSEVSDHSRIATLTSFDMVVKEMEKQINLKRLIIWSDSCASQFRSRFVFKLLSFYKTEVKLEWHYNDSHHGKGPMDGIGRTVKKLVFREVKASFERFF